MDIRKENYKEFIKDEHELEFVLWMEEEPKRMSQVHVVGSTSRFRTQKS